jgi:hypothetical protein
MISRSNPLRLTGKALAGAALPGEDLTGEALTRNGLMGEGLTGAALRGAGLARGALASAGLAILLALGGGAAVASLLGLITGTAHAAPSSPASGLDRLMALLARRKHGEVPFTERDTLSILTRPLESSGVLIYDAPDHLVKRTLRPRRESLALDGDRVTVRRRGRALQFNLDSYPQAAPYVEAIRATLAGDRAALERVFHVKFEGSLAHWRLALTPRQTRMAKRVRRIRIAGARDDIRRVEILERDGDRSVMRLGPPSAP